MYTIYIFSDKPGSINRICSFITSEITKIWHSIVIIIQIKFTNGWNGFPKKIMYFLANMLYGIGIFVAVHAPPERRGPFRSSADSYFWIFRYLFFSYTVNLLPPQLRICLLKNSHIYLDWTLKRVLPYLLIYFQVTTQIADLFP